MLYMIGGDIDETIMRQAEMDKEIDELLQCPGVSDKRVLVFPQAAVASIAAASGEKIRVQDPNVITRKNRSNNNNNNNKTNSKPVKGEWKKRDRTAPKPRGYENFKRFDSLTPE